MRRSKWVEWVVGAVTRVFAALLIRFAFPDLSTWQYLALLVGISVLITADRLEQS